MAVPKHSELHRPTLEALASGEVKTIKEINAYIQKHFYLTEDDLNEKLPSGRQSTFLNRTSWARVYLKKAGLIVSPKRSQFQITNIGINALTEAPEIIDSNYLMKYESFRTFRNTDGLDSKKDEAEPTKSKVPASDRKPLPKDEVEDQTPDDRFEAAFSTIRNNLASELIEEVMKLTPRAFEQFALDLLGRIGYGVFENSAHVTDYVADDGIDGIIKEDKLGFSLIYVQAKQWDPTRTVGNSDLRNFVGALAGKNGKGLFITTAKFSQKAVTYARNQHIVLIDGMAMANLMIEHNFGVSVKKTFEIKDVDSDVFEEYEMEDVL